MSTEIEQGSPEWHALRCGKVTASRIVDVMATIKSGEAASRKNYRAQLVAERLTGTCEEGFTSAEMKWGTEKEPDACDAYAYPRGLTLQKIAFVDHPRIFMTGASPDRLVGDDGLIEVKCPNTATHIKTLLGGSVPSEYIMQMQWQMACTQRTWCDFVSYDPRLPDHLRLFVRRVMFDAELVATVEAEVIKFLGEVTRTVAQLEKFSGAA